MRAFYTNITLFKTIILFIFVIFIFSGCGDEVTESLQETTSTDNSSSGHSTSDNSSSGTTGTSSTGTTISAEDTSSSKGLIAGVVISKKCASNCPPMQAVVWDLNGNMTVISDTSKSAYINDATVKNHKAYLLGSEGSKAGYWLVDSNNNAEMKELEIPSNYKSEELSGIAISTNNDVYVSGTISKKKNKKYINRAVYWKNGKINDLPDETSPQSHKIGVDSNGNVFIAGWQGTTHHRWNVIYWKNGVKKTLTSTYDGEATDVAFNGNDVYFSGHHGNIAFDGAYRASYWKNGKINKTPKVKTAGKPTGWFMDSEAWAIHLEGSTVYMAGFVNVVNVGQVPVYWKNKTKYELPVDYNQNSCVYCRAETKDISVIDGKVIVVGTYSDVDQDYIDNMGEQKAAFWLDNKLHKLCDTCGYGEANALLVED